MASVSMPYNKVPLKGTIGFSIKGSFKRYSRVVARATIGFYNGVNGVPSQGAIGFYVILEPRAPELSP